MNDRRTSSNLSRRGFVREAAGLGLGAMFALTSRGAPAARLADQRAAGEAPSPGEPTLGAISTRAIGIFTHIVPGGHAAKAKLVREAGFTCVQWYPALDQDSLDEATFRRVASIYRTEQVPIAAVAGYANLFDPRPEVRQAERERLRQILRLAPACGCPLVCTETGTLNPARGSHPDNTRPEIWDEFVDLTGELLAEAKRAGSVLVLEAYTKNVCRDARDIARLLAAVGRPPHLRFVMDPFNVVYEHELANVAPVLETYFAQIGAMCPVVHAKDLVFEVGEKVTPRSGTGIFDWSLYAQLLQRDLPQVPLILEHLKWPEVAETLAFVQAQLGRAKS